MIKEQYKELFSILDDIKETINKELNTDLSEDEYLNLYHYLCDLSNKVRFEISQGIIYDYQ